MGDIPVTALDPAIQHACQARWLEVLKCAVSAVGNPDDVFLVVFEPGSCRVCATLPSPVPLAERFGLPRLQTLARVDLLAGRPVVLGLPGVDTAGEPVEKLLAYPILFDGCLTGAACAVATSCQAMAAVREVFEQWSREIAGSPDEPRAEEGEPGLPSQTMVVVESRELDELARENRALRALVEMSARAAGNALHELRSPLVAIRGYARMLADGRAGDLAASQHGFINVIAQNAGRMVGLLNGFPRASALEQLRLEVVNLPELWEESLDRYTSLVHSKNINVTIDLPRTMLRVFADRAALQQVFDGLLDNAVTFTGDGGTIAAQFSSTGEDEIRFSISDTGPGIAPGLADRIFDRYYQSEGSEPGEDERAVHLPLVHDIVRLHGGRISVASGSGEGCTFVLELPVSRLLSEEVFPRNDQASSSRSGR